MSERDQRVKAYQAASRKADELSNVGKEEEARQIVTFQRDTAAQVGDEDYHSFFEAEALLISGEPQQAAQRLDAGLDWAKRNGYPGDAFLLCCRGVYDDSLGHDDAAIHYFDNALGSNPKDAAALRSKGVSLLNQGKDAQKGWLRLRPEPTAPSASQRNPGGED
jgi:tetratricopeptide (TPR) repeat protein